MNKGGIIAINKPSGWICTHILNELQKILRKSCLYSDLIDTSYNPSHKRRRKSKELDYGKIKIGHGGTLDPLASGVLVIGIGKGTKKLKQFLQCTKEYQVTALFGCSTDTYDSNGKIIKRMPWSHLTKEIVEKALDNFKGNILQKPPQYSALHMKGKRLYEYAREGLELPEEIKSRSITVESFDIINWTHDHEWEEPKDDNNMKEDLKNAQKMESTINCNNVESNILNDQLETTNKLFNNNNEQKSLDNTVLSVKQKAPAVTFRVVVSSGTYIRSLIHDLGMFLDSAAHVVELIRCRQGKYKLNENTIDWSKFENGEWESDFIKALSLKSSSEP
ncbi:hypothetical protein PORY_000290 [Pneumocystis oryctolagi]|uniref:Uncharacterized protein n=1 Tax=Pneumocystis oryctolagi TaxID=42067 RepID=A0ACB7CET4_9ASCO|nr:hypothetical protein PORY_000290 [Pneumocystis oryctolagi]